jgi:D-alanyl-D-alanine carboxypeptidase/D-alanyl-D-alanine-endopeptidase (penicillin-binding protein 4)
LVHSLTKHDTLYSVNPRKLLMPASGLKVVTLAAAAERLGWTYTFETSLATVGTIRDGVLEGDVVVVGHGDPSLTDRDGSAAALFESWADQLKSVGVRTISGRVIGNDNAFDDERFGNGWAWDDLALGYATGIGALQLNENTAQITIEPGERPGLPAVVAISPTTNAGLGVRSTVMTGPRNTPPSIMNRRLNGSAVLEISGTIPSGSPPIVRTVSVMNPTVYFVSAFRDTLLARGIDVVGPAVDIDDVENAASVATATPMLVHQSAPLATLAQPMMKFSLNLYAETVFRTLGVGMQNGGTVDAGRAAVLAVLNQWGISTAGALIADGSGLSRYNLVTAEMLVSVLTHVYDDDRHRAVFEETLPIAGKDGTLARRMVHTAAEGNARAKTGTLANARTLAGFVKTRDGEPLVFAILANNFGVPSDIVDRVADAVVVALAEFNR